MYIVTFTAHQQRNMVWTPFLGGWRRQCQNTTIELGHKNDLASIALGKEAKLICEIFKKSTVAVYRIFIYSFYYLIIRRF